MKNQALFGKRFSHPLRLSVAFVLALMQIALATASTNAPAKTLDKIKASGSITLGIREASYPLSYLDDKQQAIGYHIDICKKLVEAIQEKLKLPALKVQHHTVTTQNRIPLLVNNTIDIECGSTTNNADRQKRVAFAPTTFVSHVRMVVKKSSGMTQLAHLDGKTVATTTGTTAVKLIRLHRKGQGIEFREVYGKDHSESFSLLEADRADAFVIDDNLLAGLILSARNPADYAIVGEVLNVEPIAIMYRKNDPALKALVDSTITDLMKRGEIDRLYTKWFMSTIPPQGVSMNFPMSEKLKELIKKPSTEPAEAYNK